MKLRTALILSLVMMNLVTAAQPIVSRVSTASPTANNLLQYQAGGHVIGFQADKVYLAALDHALSVEFVGGADVTPQPLAAPDNSFSSSGERPGAKAFNVTYPDVWPGIDVAYQTSADGLAESTYTVAPGAAAEQIRL